MADVGSNKARLRLEHGANSLPDSGLSLVADFSALADDVGYASASSYSALGSGGAQQIDVTSPLSSTALFTVTDPSLQADGVYTVFMLDGGSAPAGVLRKDR